MNWGNSIILTFVLFASFVIYLVVQTFRASTDLVAEDYYAQEINYQQKIEQRANLEKLGEKVSVVIEGGGDRIYVSGRPGSNWGTAFLPPF